MGAATAIEQCDDVVVVTGDILLAASLGKTFANRLTIEREGSTHALEAALRDDRPWLALVLDVCAGREMALVTEARRLRPRVPVLVCAALDDPRAANELRLCGAEIAFRPDVTASITWFLERAIATRSTVASRTLHVVHAIARRHAFSRRERELAELVAIGVPRIRLARELGVKENTVKTMIRQVLGKVGEDSIESFGRTILEEALEQDVARTLWAVPPAQVPPARVSR